ncbi:MAG: hypothetical protein AAB885_02010 [Patescibacteria group bacterium]
MKNYNLKFKTGFYFLVVIFTFSFLFFHLVTAQATPEFMVSWKADSYVPSDYRGKILPSPSSSIEMAFELIDGGRIANISNNQVRWYVNGRLYRSGAGLKSITYVPAQFDRQNREAHIEIIGYRGLNLEKRFTVPVAEPSVVIVPISQNEFRALPYFFNISSFNQLQFDWRANDLAPENIAEHPDLLTLSNLAPGLPISLSVTVKNLNEILEIAGTSLNFITQ